MSRCFISLLAWGALACLAAISTRCAIDPLALFPPSDASSIPEDAVPEDKRAACYQLCLDKGIAPATCKTSCYPSDPAKDCYEPCIRAGQQASLCGAKCYAKEPPETLCFGLCTQSGIPAKECGARTEAMTACVKAGGEVLKCQQSSCPFNPTAECYYPCIKAGLGGEKCKLLADGYSACFKSTRSAETCLKKCLVF